jgi:diguanylate cyclase (GGDEF)-like protein
MIWEPMTQRRLRSFDDETGSTPLLRLTDSSASGPKRPCLVMLAGPRLGEIYPIEGELVIGRDPAAQLRLAEDESVSRRHAMIRATPEGGALLRDLSSANGTFVDGERVTERPLKEGAKIRVGQTVVLKFALYDEIEELAQRQLLDSALRDGLTEAFNRRYFIQRLGAEICFAERHSSTVALLIIDLDHFKQINDRYGHPYGDRLLRKLADVLRSALRAEDVLARFGGEEFAVLARGISGEQARALADRLRRLVGATPFGKSEVPGEAMSLTVSIGIAVFPLLPPRELDETTDDARTLLGRADLALLRAKQSGRNRVEG